MIRQQILTGKRGGQVIDTPLPLLPPIPPEVEEYERQRVYSSERAQAYREKLYARVLKCRAPGSRREVMPAPQVPSYLSAAPISRSTHRTFASDWKERRGAGGVALRAGGNGEWRLA